jgi:hypothetical protein
MNSQLATVQPIDVRQSRSLSAADIRHRVNTIQEVMTAVMKKDVHYGIIPGCKKPSLYKPGSEVLLATFQIATSIHVTDLSTDDCIRYQVRVIGTHAPSGVVLGEGIGECSSNEEKYKWRKAYDDEWNATPENRRRIKFGKYKDKQVRTEPADVANTILKMAKKRAQVDAVITATAASDIFTQDIEDLPEEVVAEIVSSNRASPGNAAVQQTIKDGPERDAADKEAAEVASMGVEAFRKLWAGWSKDKRALVADLVPKYQQIAEKADAEVAE